MRAWTPLTRTLTSPGASRRSYACCCRDLGNGAVFKLVPEYFPRSVGSVTGLVGAAGGLGGFFPPLVLGVIKQQTGAFTWGFILLGAFALICLGVLLGNGRGKAKVVAQPA